MLIRWPVQYASYMQMSRLHVPPIFRQLPAPVPPSSLSPLPWQHKSQSILHNAMRAWLNGGVAPAPLPPPFTFLTQNMQRRFWLPLVVFAFAPRCGTIGTKGGHKTFYAAFILLLHSRRRGKGRGTASNCIESASG